ncbi:uncharacterized protein FFE2_00034 [Fusarium fujikuroi]|nr:uncharacterized protein FFE2_00034 [Fusarium fujikuroi]SCV25963.1 uncharacterized protein FFFS_00031 [Fusarium fujikuroi]
MPLYIYNISAVTCFYLAIFYLNTYKDISIKVILASLLLPIIKALLSLFIPLSNLATGF